MPSDRATMATSEVRVQAAVESAVSMVRPQLEEKGHELTIEPIDPALVATVDLEKLQQILVNLLANAVKFTDRGGRITMSASGNPREVSITVRDTGIGIPRDQHQRIFEPFVQLDTGPSRRVQGTGLGLAISRELAHAMGGDLEVESDLGAGAAFTLRLSTDRAQGLGPRA
jgi:signal transduction histidine kinase